MVRQAWVAGQFYPGKASELSQVLRDFLAAGEKTRPAHMIVSPHAGYVYSGKVAGKVISSVKIPRKVVVVGPNHRGMGSPAAIMSHGAWETPLGLVKLDEDFGAILKSHCPLLREDETAHAMEHSLEVQVPFLQYLRDDLLLTPICLSILEWNHCQDLGLALAKAVKEAGEPVLLLASTDMTHYEPAEVAKEKDHKALDRIMALDPQGLFEVVRKGRISMCGVLPTTVCLIASLELGAKEARLLEYTNSGAVNNDYRQVVGYAGVVIN
jgi:hypothetical protein